MFKFFMVFYIKGIVGGDFFVRKICKFLNLPSTAKAGIVKSGRIIDFFERFIIITFFLLKSFEVIGLFFTGKSIIRLTNRQESEYYLVGRLSSFSWVIMFAWILKIILKI